MWPGQGKPGRAFMHMHACSLERHLAGPGKSSIRNLLLLLRLSLPEHIRHHSVADPCHYTCACLHPTLTSQLHMLLHPLTLPHIPATTPVTCAVTTAATSTPAQQHTSTLRTTPHPLRCPPQTEKLLLYGGAIHEAGEVKARRATRHATSDWMELEKQRGISITSTAMTFEYLGHTINLLDTPGHQDFSEDTYRCGGGGGGAAGGAGAGGWCVQRSWGCRDKGGDT